MPEFKISRRLVRMGEYVEGGEKGNEKPAFKDMKDLCVGDIYQLVCAEPASIKLSQNLTDAIKAMIEKPLSQKVYVIDNENKLIGTITMQTVLRQVGYIYGVREPGMISFFKFMKEILKEDLQEFMNKKPAKVTKTDKVLDALKLMVSSQLNNLPVVDENNVLIGELDGIEILKRALKA
jgi:predicted transcriptional regulator